MGILSQTKFIKIDLQQLLAKYKAQNNSFFLSVHFVKNYPSRDLAEGVVEKKKKNTLVSFHEFLFIFSFIFFPFFHRYPFSGFLKIKFPGS